MNKNNNELNKIIESNSERYLDIIKYDAISENTVIIENDETRKKSLGFSQKNNPAYFYFEIELNFNEFVTKIKPFINIDKRYAILVKLSDTKGFERTAGNHIAFKINTEDDLERIFEVIYEKAAKSIKLVVAEYNFVVGVDIVKIQLIELKIPSELDSHKKFNITDLNLDKKITSIKDLKRNFSNTYLPVSMDKKLFGHKLIIEYEDSIVKTIKYGKFCIYDSRDTVNKEKLKSNLILEPSEDQLSAYIYKNNYLLIIKDKKIHESQNIQLERIIEVFEYDIKIKSTLTKIGKPKLIVYDKILDNNDKYFRRKINNDTLYINNNQIIKYEKDGILPIIASKLDRKFKSTRNSFIGVLDTETYYNSEEDMSYVYSLGFKIMEGEEKLFYLNNNQSSEELIIECIKSMVINKYDNYIFYVHNLSGFDIIFILKALVEYNAKNENYFILEPIFRDNKIIKLTIKIKSNKKYIKISLYDSYLMIPFSLDSIAKSFKCELNKTYFPYEFPSQYNLDYEGTTPNKDLFKNISEEEYKQIYKNN
jgi:hypothetical protein